MKCKLLFVRRHISKTKSMNTEITINTQSLFREKKLQTEKTSKTGISMVLKQIKFCDVYSLASYIILSLSDTCFSFSLTQ